MSIYASFPSHKRRRRAKAWSESAPADPLLRFCSRVGDFVESIKAAFDTRNLGLAMDLIMRAPLPDDGGAKHWAVLMPLLEKGNKQLNELKRSIGLGNPLDAEAVIIIPKVEDEMSKHIAEYGPGDRGCPWLRIPPRRAWRGVGHQDRRHAGEVSELCPVVETPAGCWQR